MLSRIQRRTLKFNYKGLVLICLKNKGGGGGEKRNGGKDATGYRNQLGRHII